MMIATSLMSAVMLSLGVGDVVVTLSAGEGADIAEVVAGDPILITMTVSNEGAVPVSVIVPEGRTGGAGTLLVELRHNNLVLASASAFLDLRPITQMYDHFTVGDTESMDWNEVPLVATQIQTAVDSPFNTTESPYVLFVHGWNMLKERRRQYAETAFKRLFWQGYDGRFGLYSWPTEQTDNPVTDPGNYDRSERKAYWSGWGLRGVLAQLAGTYSAGLHIFGHSMGNIVISEALRLEATSANPRQLVTSFIASQASSVAHAYDAGVPLNDNTTQTAEVYASYPPTGLPYYDLIGLAAGSLVNFFNPLDYALSTGWEVTQDSKPDAGYDYNENGWFRDGPLVNTYLFFPADRYEIYAHIAEARPRALGRQGGVGGPFNASLQIDLNARYGFGGADVASHSAQFRATNQVRWQYWQQLLVSSGI